jgi:hypothetical protein
LRIGSTMRPQYFSRASRCRSTSLGHYMLPWRTPSTNWETLPRCATELTKQADNVNTGIAHGKLGRTLLREKRYKDAEAETRAGYEILIKQSSSATSFVRGTRKDLIAEYEALKAARFRVELAKAQKAENLAGKK